MSIMIYFYNQIPAAEVEKQIDNLIEENPSLYCRQSFTADFSFSKAQPMNDAQRRVIQEYGREASSWFILSVNRKNATGAELDHAAAKAASAIGPNRTFMLFEGEAMYDPDTRRSEE